jgi:hypothetical protein
MAYNPKMFDSISPKQVHEWASKVREESSFRRHMGFDGERKLDPESKNGSTFYYRGFDPGETEPEHQTTFGKKRKRGGPHDWSETINTDALRDAIDKMNGVDNSIRDEARKGLVIDGTCRRK